MNLNKTLGFLVPTLLDMLIWKPHINVNADTSGSNFENKTAFIVVVHNCEVRRVTAET